MNNRSALPSDFVWGAATSAFQIEATRRSDARSSAADRPTAP